ncbi:MAG: hypothetical protein IPP90_05195 [Gemmatimonadaceae bacterium]|nr:hypothetical protein [Gemmatimonadaceae bacterium]
MIDRLHRLAKRHAGFILAAAGVAAAFVVVIGTGYRVTRTPGSPIGDTSYRTAIGLLVLVLMVGTRSVWRRRAAGDGPPDIDARRRGQEEQRMSDASRWADPPPDQFSPLRSRMVPLAQRIEAPAHLLPTFQHSAGNGLPHIEIKDDTYHFVRAERGAEFERFSTTSVDELLYRIFRDVTWSMAADLARPRRKPGEDFRRAMFTQQLALLGRLNPGWTSRCAAEQVDVLTTFPFVDDANG